MSNQIFVSPNWKNWKVHKPWAKRANAITETKQEALQIARQIAKNQWLELIVQRKDGKIHMKDSYGNDPRSIKW